MMSHLMPAALYGRGDKSFQVSTPSGTLLTRTQMKQSLLCRVCEQRFNDNGEAHVLKAIAPKDGTRFPLHERMRVAYARDNDASAPRFHGPDFGLEMEKFAYFAISVVWRIGACRWKMQDGTLTQDIQLGDFQTRIGKYLLGEIPLPGDMAVIVIVCSDAESRRWFMNPTGIIEDGCINFRILARGVFFRVMLGHQMAAYLREQSCTQPIRPIFYGDCEKRTLAAIRPPAL